ncbi:Endo-beta-N-acetylglucosaminidase GH85 [Chondrus crispus]|uniref:Endo-beta-N-acetylglucosaminidase GH85 n=1 Tax=Chondrus crispus TaxID=2769 RepID=R7Q0N4_CHOCR|nr:Endo-beta-N-acetylglucosaminidase GH85 [Chondrus crispus]CDF32212.1 Endo-beta-N-acetylglucosaminidase GH85 [Chondrus crispus]|eukprot:XP_005711877.1 Endo-beta-N-acetylglucosaminidase GH85 [Chondrus crispus]
MWRFNHWAYVDIFVYFSHYCVTIPPVGYIHAAHKHGALVLGTLIFEWEKGAKELQNILVSFKTRARAASQLASIAKFYGFDGWLVNVEVELPGGSSAASDLAAFVGDLTRATRKIVGLVSEVIWYDSVTRDGSLRWQNELNQDNEQFFKAAGSIFTNYHWDRNAPVRSAVKAGTRRTDVFTGIDIHGRKTYGGGGFQAHLALRAIKQGGTSAALFAPAWTVEKCPPNVSDPRELEDRFWTGPSGRFGRESVAQYFKERPVLTQIPFSTSFDPGWGPRLMEKGVVKSPDRYFNMAQQHIQPSFMRTYVAAGDVSASELCLSHEEAFNGSASIKTRFAFSESRMLSGSFAILRLLVANLTFPTRLSSRITKSQEGAIRVSYSYLAKSEKDPISAGDDFGLVFMVSSPPGALLLVGENSKWNDRKGDAAGHRIVSRMQILGKFVNFEVVVATSDQAAIGAPPAGDGTTGWKTRSFILEGSLTSGQRLGEVMIITGGPPQQPISVNPSPFISPSVSRGISRVGSRSASRIGSAATSRANSPPRRGYDREDSMGYRNRGLATVGDSGTPARTGDADGDDFGSDLLSKYRQSFGPRRPSESGISRGQRPEAVQSIGVGFDRRQISGGWLQRGLDGDDERAYDNQNRLSYHPRMPEARADRGDREVQYAEPRALVGGQRASSYAHNFQVDGTIDYGEMEEDDQGMYSASTSRALSRLGSRLQTPIGSRPLSRFGSRLGSLHGSRSGSMAGSRLGSRVGSMAGSRTGSFANSLANSRAGSRQGSRFASPSMTPHSGGGGAMPLSDSMRRLSTRGMIPASGTEFDRQEFDRQGEAASGMATPSRSNAALSDLKSALMQAAGSMAGEAAEGRPKVVGSVSTKSCIVYLGELSIEVITDTDKSMPALFDGSTCR